MMKKNIGAHMILLMLIGALILTTGCSESNDEQAEAKDTTLPTSLFLAQAPTGVQSITSLKADAKEGDSVVIEVVAGGRKQSYVPNRAVMMVVDAKLDNPCLSEDDHCSTPWDYCCTPSDQLVPQMASVKILGPDEQPLVIDLKTVDRLSPLTSLVIQGTVGPRPNDTVLVINATGIFVAAKKG